MRLRCVNRLRNSIILRYTEAILIHNSLGGAVISFDRGSIVDVTGTSLPNWPG